MRRLRLRAIVILVAGLACAGSAPAFANILIQIDKPSQPWPSWSIGNCFTVGRLDRSYRLLNS